MNKHSYIQHLISRFPKLKAETLTPLVSENLVSAFTVELDKKIMTQANAFAKSLFGLRKLPAYQQHFSEELSAKGIKDPKNHSILMSYDFHIDGNGLLKLIEVNTNAAFMLLGTELYAAAKMEVPFSEKPLELLKKSIENEMQLFVGKKHSKPNICIVDDTPENQRLYVEFLAYKSLFEEWGWKAEIFDFRNVPKDVNFVYNRYTDFYLQSPEAEDLKKRFSEHSTCFSPNPHEYFLMADKSRMMDWTTPGFLEKFICASWTEEDRKILLQHLPKTFVLGADKATEIWARRKHYFFKPRSAYGAKQTYKGASISQKTFTEICTDQFIAQEHVPAPERVYSTPDGHSHLYKFDLRFYAYEDEIQMAIARIYQGQVTNLKTPHGGFACIKFN